ncbi:MAG: TIGR04211 family SH3 domain-containing protein [Gammaproteobacteria bacterium]|nr:TIGR04211 family SH3 domain-containing protein [Gammaproteobacteria bacterium]
MHCRIPITNEGDDKVKNAFSRLIVIFGFILCSPLMAATSYVSDDFEITLRSEKGSGKKILKMLATGTPLEVLERDDEEGYALVRTSSGTEGWVLTRYLSAQPVAKTRLEAATDRMQKMRTEIKELKDQVDELKSSNANLEKSSTKLSKNEEKLQKEIETIKKVSSDQLALYEENQQLKSELLTLRRDIQNVQQEKIRLEDDSAKDWFLIGAGVCIAGIIGGLVMPNVTSRRRSSWSSL